MLAVSRALERGALAAASGPLARALEGAWVHTFGRSVVRRLRWPAGVRVVAVGGATLGGSGKTPLAIACAEALAARGARVALVGHAYRASPGRPRVVSFADPLGEVGDEALVAARALAGRAQVVVAPTRVAAIELAARLADVLVLDGVLQTAPVRASLALLAVDAVEPWGHAEAVPPRGDLRAPTRALLEAADRVVAVGDGPEIEEAGDAADRAWIRVDGAQLGAEILRWERIRSLRVGLICALARPERLLRTLARRGVVPAAVIRGRDHGPIAPPRKGGKGGGPRVDLWLATPKCALHAHDIGLSAPLATLVHELRLSSGLVAALTAAALGNTLK